MTLVSHAKGGALTRRRFVTGAGIWGALVTAGTSPHARAQSPMTGQPAATPSTRFDLGIERLHANMTGHRVRAVGVNGSIPAPILRWRQGDTVELNVTNHLHEDSSIHWHGIRLPAAMDGVPGLSFAGIPPGETFTYRFRLHQSGTYWYHSHSGFQEQQGMYGAIIIDPRHGETHHYDREYVMVLSDWTDVAPADIVSNLKFDSDYYNFRQRTVGTLFHDMRHKGISATLHDRLQWGGMNMAPTDILDVSGIIYTYLLNGHSPQANWTGLFGPGERIRLRFINASSMTLFDIRIPGLEMTVIQADGNEVEPVTIDEFRIGTAETYDVLVTPRGSGPYTIFAQAEDRTGYARGTLATRAGVSGPIPPMDPRPLRTMTDMGMGNMDMHTPSSPKSKEMEGMDMSHMTHDMPAHSTPRLRPGVEVQSIAMMPINRLAEAGDGLDHNGRRVLTYADLRATIAGADPRPPSREITLHLTGNMQRFIWGFDGKKFSEADAIRLTLGERVRFIVINDTMMEHPIHLHGFWSELENGQGEYRPYKHTIIVKPGERLSYLVTVDEPGMWAYHCHLLYHMELGMFRTVIVS
ncbi:copper resistance system multicopper oxidase [Novacetimonas hansenii]|uniref:copper resistance system multicopper oxidase n=1 Tax=Novacetimonas hansenii TaxID=436 RepID=UPI001780824C|nr:copper resistance system multicopper oxidase [Novacetimonas hansenii]QOF93976.1 copper resistance system multicopper oxidase [Novacetimonas hansenii]